jgi:hypothetical protein
MFLRRNLMATEAFQLMKDELDELYRSGGMGGRIMSIGLHPHIIRRAFRARAIREFLEYQELRRGVVGDARGDRGVVFAEPWASPLRHLSTTQGKIALSPRVALRCRVACRVIR